MILHNSFAYDLFGSESRAKIRKILSRKIFGNCILLRNPSAWVEWNAIKCEITWVAHNLSRLTEAHPQKISLAAVIKKAKIISKPNRA